MVVVVGQSPVTAWWLLFGILCLLPGVCCLALSGYCLVNVVRQTPVTAWWLLLGRVRLLSAVCC